MRVVVPSSPVGFGFNELQDCKTTGAQLGIVTVLPQGAIVRTDDTPILDKKDMDVA
jgi:hypothetical protein